MRWSVKQIDIIDEPADVLICSANPWLNLSGGVGVAFRERYGDAMQLEMHRYLADRNLKQVPAGSAVVMPPFDSPYLGVVHAVGIDVFYQSSVSLIAKALSNSLAEAAQLGAKKVALAAVATGYGRMLLEDFASAVTMIRGKEFSPLDEAVICVRKAEDAELLQKAILG